MLKKLSLAVVAAGMLSMLAGAADARVFRYASYLPPKHNLNSEAMSALDELSKASKGAMDWKLFPAGQLFKARAAIDGIGKGTADASFVIVHYFRKQLPHAFTLAVEMSAMGGMPLTNNVVGGDIMLFGCPECAKDYRKNNTIWLSGLTATPQIILCQKEARKVSDLKGLKVRTSGASGRLAKALGATPVGMTSGELLIGLERGQIDCVLGSAAWLISHRLIDKVKYVIDYPMIATRGLGCMVMNLDVWKKLTPDLRKATFQHAAKCSARVTFDAYVRVAKKARVEAEKKGVVWTDGTAELEPFMKKYRVKEADIIVKRAKKRGFADAGKLIDDFYKGYAKWDKVIQAAGGESMSTADYERLLWDNVYSKVDPEKL